MRTRKLFIDGLGLVEGHFSGIGQYILGMLKGFDEILEEKKLAGEHHPDIVVVIPYDTLPRFRSFGFKHLKVKRLPFTFHFMSILWQRGWMPPIDLFCGRGHYLFTRFVSMPLLFSKSSLIVYDLSFELHRQYSDEGNAIFLSAGTKKSIDKSNTVFTISKSVRNELIKFYDLPKKMVKVAYPAVDQRLFYKKREEEIESVKKHYSIEGDYVLALSNLEPRKNLTTLVDAYCAMPKKYKDQVGLLIVGVSGWKTDKLFDKVLKKVEEGENIMRPTGYVPDHDKPAVLSGAKMLVYPSHYEGFGIPPLEALACGTPVISADNSSLPEAVGDAATMINATDTKKMKESMMAVIDNYKKYSDKARVEGPRHAEKFSWKQSAQVYWDQILGDNK